MICKTTDEASGITNAPNDWAREHKKPRYILDLLLSVINVSIQSVDIAAKKKRVFISRLGDIALERIVNRDGIRVYG